MRLPWGGTRSRRAHAVTVYTKPGCPLCDEALSILRDLQFQRVLAVEVENIEDDPELFRQYAERIPVLLLDARITLDPPITVERVCGILDQLDHEISDEPTNRSR